MQPVGPSTAESIEVEQPPIQEYQSQGLFVSQDPDMEIRRDRTSSPTSQLISGRKRAPSPIIEDDEDLMDQLAPAATALKKRKLADDVARKQRGESTPPPQAIQREIEEVVKSPLKKIKKEKKEIDVLEHARQQREKEEATARAEREALEAALEGMDIGQIRNLAVIEEMEVKRTRPPARDRAHGDEGERWDDRWNGRKNFKKFRRRTTEGERPRRFDRVIVPLEEVKKKDFGIGDDYWFEGDNSQLKKRRKGKGKDTQEEGTSQSQLSGQANQTTLSQNEDVGEEAAHPEQVNRRASDDELPETSLPAITSTQSQHATRSQSLAEKSKTSGTSPRKRQAAAPLVKTAPVKKPRQLLNKNDSDESEDEFKFKFRRRG